MATSNLAGSPQQNEHTPSTVYSTRDAWGGGVSRSAGGRGVSRGVGGIPQCTTHRTYP